MRLSGCLADGSLLVKAGCCSSGCAALLRRVRGLVQRCRVQAALTARTLHRHAALRLSAFSSPEHGRTAAPQVQDIGCMGQVTRLVCIASKATTRGNLAAALAATAERCIGRPDPAPGVCEASARPQNQVMGAMQI